MKRDVTLEQQIEDSLEVTGSDNKAERLSWFADQGLGAFIHLSCDVQLGGVISHNLINATEDYCRRYFDELPRTYCPDRFDARAWARFFRSVGMRYVVLTQKHHNGFCMWHTTTTPFSIANTPYGKDMTRELFDACRAEGLAIGVYFSPDDFHEIWKQGKRISRDGSDVLPKDNPELMSLGTAQVTELLTDYGPIDVIFFDGDPTGLRELTWRLQPDCVVTRGALRTPEQYLPEVDGAQEPSAIEPWEACFTMGRQWQYRGVSEVYKSPCQLVEMLITTRAGGGNLLLNFGPKPDGSLDPEQEAITRALGMWLFANGEAIYDTRPYHIAREGDVFYTHAPQLNTVYAHLTNIDWPSLPHWTDPEEVSAIDPATQLDGDGLYKARARRLQWRLKGVRAGSKTLCTLLAQRTDTVMPKAITESVVWQQQGDNLIITAWHCHRQYNDWFYDLPVVVAIRNPG
jgi:alpha-L-fucosidase